jgi:hypothetical protein
MAESVCPAQDGVSVQSLDGNIFLSFFCTIEDQVSDISEFFVDKHLVRSPDFDKLLIARSRPKDDSMPARGRRCGVQDIFSERRGGAGCDWLRVLGRDEVGLRGRRAGEGHERPRAQGRAHSCRNPQMSVIFRCWQRSEGQQKRKRTCALLRIAVDICRQDRGDRRQRLVHARVVTLDHYFTSRQTRQRLRVHGGVGHGDSVSTRARACRRHAEINGTAPKDKSSSICRSAAAC